MTTKLDTKRNLRQLLDKLIQDQKEDIYAYSSGHLNETKLFQPPPASQPRRLTWANGSSQTSSQSRSCTSECCDSTEMQNALADFTLGFSGGVHNRMTTAVKSLEANKMPKELRSRKLRSVTPLPLAGGATRRSTSQQQLTVGTALLPRHLESLTKTEEFWKLKSYEAEVIQKQELLLGNVVSAKDIVDQMENKLDTNLELLDHLGFGLGYHRLEAHSKTFDEVIDSSKTFGSILSRVKRSYDDYLSHLLKGNVTKHKVLQNQLSQLTDMNMTNATAIQQEAKALDDLERRGKIALDENKRLRDELRREQELGTEPKPEILKTVVTRLEHIEPSERIEKLNTAICKQMDTTKQLRDKIRSECVPTKVCTYLRHCIKETDVDIQRMTSQKEYYEHSISELTADLREAIETADTTDRDAKKIWKKLESQMKRAEEHKGQELWGISRGGGAAKNDESETDEEDESDKWNWYIS